MQEWQPTNCKQAIQGHPLHKWHSLTTNWTVYKWFGWLWVLTGLQYVIWLLLQLVCISRIVQQSLSPAVFVYYLPSALHYGMRLASSNALFKLIHGGLTVYIWGTQS